MVIFLREPTKEYDSIPRPSVLFTVAGKICCLAPEKKLVLLVTKGSINLNTPTSSWPDFENSPKWSALAWRTPYVK
jgi:hypothetical protein